MKIISIVGTRPQFIKLASLSNIFKKDCNIIHTIIHTGQHFDKEMSSEMFRLLDIKTPDYNLNINSNTTSLNHGTMTGKMMIEIENILLLDRPNFVLVYGDCNTTLAGALTSSKLNIPLVHIEAGLRCYNKTMPEEINRIMVDHISTILCCPDIIAVNNLKKEDITKNVYITGNLQIDLLKKCFKNDNSLFMKQNNLVKNNFILLTIHRHYNTTKLNLTKIFEQLKNIGCIFFPIHPRTKKIIDMHNIIVPSNIILHAPVDYITMISLQNDCTFIITDSGGIQPEAHYLDKKCFIIRPETEWIYNIINGNNFLIDIDNDNISEKINNINKNKIKYDYIDCGKNIYNLLNNFS